MGLFPWLLAREPKVKIEAPVVDPVSQAIAEYLMEHGRKSNPWPEEEMGIPRNLVDELSPGHYRIDKVFDDGRKLTAYFCNVNNRPVNNPMRNCRLEFDLAPAREDQFGYSTTEYGLSGKFNLFQILLGSNQRIGFSVKDFGEVQGDIHMIDGTHYHIQQKYDRFRTWVLEQIRGGESE